MQVQKSKMKTMASPARNILFVVASFAVLFAVFINLAGGLAHVWELPSRSELEGRNYVGMRSVCNLDSVRNGTFQSRANRPSARCHSGCAGAVGL